MTGRATSPEDVTNAEQPIVFVIDGDESMRRSFPIGELAAGGIRFGPK